MSYRFMTACCLLICSVLAFSADTYAAEGKTRVLMLTQSKGFTHGSVKRQEEKLAPAEIAMIQLGKQSDLFTVDCTQDAAADFTKENLQNYDIVMFYTTGMLPIKEEDMQYFLNDWLKQKGHGFIGFHSATDTYKTYEPYWDMIGGSFNGHPWNAGNTVTITVHNPDFPAMKPFGKEFQFKDEIYQYKNWQPEKVHVLMSLNMEKSNPKRPYQVPVAWAKEWGEGKVFVNNLGHNPETWANPKFQESVIGAIKWIRGDAPAAVPPNPELSKKEDERAAAAAKSESK
ncbi:ThuA domain-containing protein [Gimesia sp.]|uniref:ThuA domain-containing protein n=1 Tax=Gimesia sp. TaxID=2024833 RepID=UPI000C65798E|nr:ThuA domain-containing protein [Gimesia sp.]MAX36728.1 glycosyl hydrolase [Gimesia sp.]|tara:strand:- start:4118 stop:4975 length:858 start_codon:yes stop_codon:yes gene_type:complete